MTYVDRHTYRWFAGLVLVAIFCIGCASARPAATSLASQGGTTARSIEAAFAKMETDLDLMVDRRIMQAALTGRNPPSPQALQNIDRVRKAMNARRKLSGDLARLYDSFAALAAYDASAEVTTAFRQVSANAYELATAINESNAVSASFDDLAARLAGALATSIQNVKLRQTSAVIRESLGRVRDLLTQEAHLYASVRGELERVAGAASLELYRSGIGRPYPLLRELLNDREFSYDEKQVKLALERGPRSKEIQNGIQEIVKHRINRRMELEAMAISGFASVLAQLEQEHRAFEAEQPLDLSGVAERLAAFRQVVDLINEARREPVD